MFRVATAILPLMFSLSVSAQSIFTISPYITVEDQGRITLNFQTIKDVQLEVKLQEQKKRISGFYSASKLTKIDFGTIICDKPLRYTISSESRTEIDNALVAIPCTKKSPLYFGFMSDTQIKNEAGQVRANELSKTISTFQKAHSFSLIINAGDIVQHGGFENEWINFFNTVDIYLRRTYLMAAVGNHEYFESPSIDIAPPEFLTYMRNGHSPDLGYMQLDLGRINILMLNSNFESMTESKIIEQWEWLEAKLKISQEQKKPTVVTMHHSPYSSNLEHIRTIPTRLRAELVPMLEKYGVKMVLSGHLHMYERSYKAGITYLTAGPSGGINNVVSYKNPYSVFYRQFITTFSVLKLNGNFLEVITYGGDKSVIERFNVKLFDGPLAISK